MNAAEKGTLYGIGVGPGDPKLLTLKAIEALGVVDVVFAANSTKNHYSLALDIVKPHLAPEVEVRLLGFPMTKDETELYSAWEQNALEVQGVLDAGRDAAFITIGDSLTYSTYGYLLKRLLQIAPDSRVETIPGVTAYHAAAARLNLPLVEAKESLLVVSGVNDPDEIPELAACCDNLVIMKAYRNYDQLVDALETLPRKRPAYLVSNCCRPGERVHEDAYGVRGEKMPYLSLIIAKQAPKDDVG